MPNIIASLKRSALSDTEYDLLEIVDRNPGFMWSNQLTQLAEIAAWQLQPRRPARERPIALLPQREIPGDEGIEEPFKDINLDDIVEPDTLHLHDRVQARVYTWSNKNSDLLPTLSLRMISNYLYRLVDLGYIMGFLLSKRTHFASFKSEQIIIGELDNSVPPTVSVNDFDKYPYTDSEENLALIKAGKSPFRNWASNRKKEYGRYMG